MVNKPVSKLYWYKVDYTSVWFLAANKKGNANMNILFFCSIHHIVGWLNDECVSVYYNITICLIMDYSTDTLDISD